jgi:hypothetical protein
MTVETDIKEILKRNFLDLNFVATATGIKREGGPTSAEIEAAREQENK